MTTLAQRKAQVAANKAARERLVATVLYLDERGLKTNEIGKEVGRSPMAVSRILTSNGRRKKTMGVRRPTKRRLMQVTCSKCGEQHQVRTDRKPPFSCPGCRPRFPKGHVPHNKGAGVPRKCKWCGEMFKVRPSSLTRRSVDGFRYAWGSYCCRECYGFAQRTPGSRYSEVDKGYPSRRFGRKR